jgi:pimeloyl-ACP methyl ester carboxylesterase
VLAPVGEDLTPVADAFRAAGMNADALRHFNERIAGAMDLRPLLARIESPTLVIAGERDAFGGPTTDEIAEALPDPTVVTILGADHFAFLEPGSRAPWSRAVLDFLAA